MVQATLFEENQIEAQLRKEAHAFFEVHPRDASFWVLTRLLASSAFGREKAISIAAMQEEWKWMSIPVYSDRVVKAAVKSLIEERGFAIGSCRIPGQNGYYLIISDKDAEEASRPLKNEIFSLFQRLKVISPKSAFVRQLQGQISLMEPNHGIEQPASPEELRPPPGVPPGVSAVY